MCRSSIERWVYLALGALVALALWGVLLALSPAVARAQQAPTAPAAAQDAAQSPASVEGTVVEVRPGDSLWSMSEERLGPGATPQRVARLVERTYLLNRERIGAGPDLILPGQRLLLPKVRGESPKGVVESSAASAGTVGREAPVAPITAPPPTPAEARGPSLPEAAAGVSVPAIRQIAAEGSSPSPFAPLLEAARSQLLWAADAVTGVLPEHTYTRRWLVGAVMLTLSLLASVVLVLLAVGRLWARHARRRAEEYASLGWDYETNLRDVDPSVGVAQSIGQAAVLAQPGPVPRRNPVLGVFESARTRRDKISNARGDLAPERRLMKGMSTSVHAPEIRRQRRRTLVYRHYRNGGRSYSHLVGTRKKRSVVALERRLAEGGS